MQVSQCVSCEIRDKKTENLIWFSTHIVLQWQDAIHAVIYAE